MNPLNDIIAPIREDLQRFEAAYSKALSSEAVPLLSSACEYIQLKKGKRLRPILTLLAARVCGDVTEASIRTAVALEMLHAASLIHDDVVDNSDTRHGQAALHMRFNNKIAVLVGDYLFASVTAIMTAVEDRKISEILSHIVAALVEGELLELQQPDEWSEEQYIAMIEHKTAVLFSACAETGARSAQASETQCQALKQFGHELGICFQIQDDILDVIGASGMGKPTQADSKDGKRTLPYVRGVDYARARMEEHKERALNALSIFEESESLNALRELVRFAVTRSF